MNLTEDLCLHREISSLARPTNYDLRVLARLTIHVDLYHRFGHPDQVDSHTQREEEERRTPHDHA